jgi:hypothetical protein
MLAVITVVGVTATLLQRGASSASPSEAARVVDTVDPLAHLHAWDRRRSSAWADGDAAALRDLYATGSVAGRRDVRLLRNYLDRDLRVEGLTTQVLDAEVLRRSANGVVVSVTDRVVGGVAVGPESATALPQGVPVHRQVTLVRVGGEWLVADVRERSSGLVPAG